MKSICFFLLMFALVSGCSRMNAPTATVAAPTFAPVAIAQTTNAPSSTPNPNATAAETSTAVSTATLTRLPPTATEAPSQTPERRAPEILGRFRVLDLPGAGRSPTGLALLDKTVFVANRSTANIGVVYGDRAREFIPLGVNPTALVADAAKRRIFAASYETPTLFLLESNRITKQSPAGGRVNALAVASDTLYAALDSDAIVERYNADTLEKRDQLKLAQGFGVSALVVDEARKRLYAAEYGRIVAIDLDTFKELTTFDVPFLYAGFAVNPDDGSIWGGAYDEASSRAYLVGYKPDGQEIARLFIGSELQATVFDRTGRLYVLDRFANQVHVIQTPQAQLVVTLAVNESPTAAVFDAASGKVYVANQDSDNLSVIDTVKPVVETTIPLATTITALAADPVRHRVYAADSAANLVYVIEGAKIVHEVKTGNSPADLAVDATLKRLYVANRADGTVEVIDQDKLEITASRYITRFLSTVAVDSENHKLFAGSTVLNPETLNPEATFFAQGFTLNSRTSAEFERANPALQKLYVVASNGVPGSNSRLTLFRFTYDDMSESKYLGSKNGGNTTALAIDPTTNELFATNTHPLAHTSALDVFNAQDELSFTLAMSARTTALVVNPATHHLFLSHAQTFQPYAGVPAPSDVVEILDTRTFGRVDVLAVPNSPIRMALLDNTVYVASYEDGTITLIGDAVTPQASPPTPTLTPTPYPTFAETTAAPTAVSATVTPTVSAAVECVNAVPVQFAPFQDKVNEIGIAELGCTRTAATEEQAFAYQPLERGFMIDDYRDANAKKVYVFFPTGTYEIFDDTFREGDDDRICTDVAVPAGKWRPKRGFGTVWCKVPQVQALGPGLVEEQNAPTTVQTFGNATLWFTQARGVTVLWNDGTWE